MEVAGFICGNGCKQFSGKQWQLERSNSGKIVRYRQRGEVIYPAPTLQEILDELEQFTVSCFAKGHQTEVANGWNCISDDTATAAALKLWLKLKGIEA